MSQPKLQAFRYTLDHPYLVVRNKKGQSDTSKTNHSLYAITNVEMAFIESDKAPNTYRGTSKFSLNRAAVVSTRKMNDIIYVVNKRSTGPTISHRHSVHRTHALQVTVLLLSIIRDTDVHSEMCFDMCMCRLRTAGHALFTSPSVLQMSTF